MKHFKKGSAGIISIAVALCLTVGTLAVFTDRFQSQSSATAGTLDISVEQNWIGDTSNAQVLENFKPSTAVKLYYELTNKGDLPASVRETFVVTTDKPLTTETGKQCELDLYKASDITVDPTTGDVLSISGSPLTPIKTGSFTDNGTVKYTLRYDLDQVELTAATLLDNKDTHTPTYYLVLNQNVSNTFQQVNVQIDYMAQALQADNTGEDIWINSLVISESVNLGGEDISVVPQLNDN